MTCNCIDEINALPAMKAANAVVCINLFGPTRTFVETYVEKKVRGKKAPLLAATYCPFCGTPYEKPDGPAKVICAGASA